MRIIQLTWGLIQTALGGVIAMVLGLFGKVDSIGDYKRSIVIRTNTKRAWGVSLGLFIILHRHYGPQTVSHEYGHCRQSAMLGPLYLIVVGLPSFLRAGVALVTRKNREWYYTGYPERWADRLGDVHR